MILTPPMKHLVAVHSMQACYLRYTRARCQGRFDDPTLLLNRAPASPPYRTSLNQLRFRHHALIHTGIVYLLGRHVQTAIAKRLLPISLAKMSSGRKIGMVSRVEGKFGHDFSLRGRCWMVRESHNKNEERRTGHERDTNTALLLLTSSGGVRLRMAAQAARI